MTQPPHTGDHGESGFDPHGMPDSAAHAAVFLKALAHEGRLEILCQLIEGERSVTEIEAQLGMPQPKVSQLLMRLRAERIVEARREGRNVLYRMERPEVIEVITVLRRAFCRS
jgi:DNA-binding transcriptional ArsR family regulator